MLSTIALSVGESAWGMRCLCSIRDLLGHVQTGPLVVVLIRLELVGQMALLLMLEVGLLLLKKVNVLVGGGVV